MDETSGEWLYVDRAAKALGISERTMRRHMAVGRYQVSQDDDGRKRIFVANDMKVSGHAGQCHDECHANTALELVADHDDRTTELAKRLTGAYEMPLQRADHEIKTARRSAGIAWMTTVGLVLIAIAAGYWALQQGARANLAERDAETAATMAQDARRAVSDMRTMLEGTESRAAAADARAQETATKLEAATAEAKQATAQAHDLELQIANLRPPDLPSGQGG